MRSPPGSISMHDMRRLPGSMYRRPLFPPPAMTSTHRSPAQRRRARALLAVACSASAALAGCGVAGQPGAVVAGAASRPDAVRVSDVGIHKIRHVVMIVQENRSFDSYFGTYPGADGLPASDGHFTACLPDPATGGCDRPFHDPSLVNGGGPHGEDASRRTSTAARWTGSSGSPRPIGGRGCGGSRACAAPLAPSDVMGYHDAREIPNYWAYAGNFVLDDHMFQSDASWSLPAHLYEVSGWSARCSVPGRRRELRQRRRARGLPDLGHHRRRGEGSPGRQASGPAAAHRAAPAAEHAGSCGVTAPTVGGSSDRATSTRYRHAVARCRRRVKDELAKRRATISRRSRPPTTTRGPTSPTCCTSTASAGATSSPRAASLTARRQCELRELAVQRRHPGYLESAPVVHRRPRRTASWATSRTSRTSSETPGPAPCRRSPGSSPTSGTPIIRPRTSPTVRRTSPI